LVFRWEKCIKARDPKKAYPNSTWNGVFPKSYLPSFQTASEASETEVDPKKIIQKNVKSRKILAEDLIKKLTTEKRKVEVQAQNKLRQKSNNKTRSQSGNKNSQKYQRKTSIVPKTLGLRKSTDLSPKTVSEISKKKITLDNSKSEINNTMLESSNKFDFSSLITSTLPQLHHDIIPTSPYSMNTRFPMNKGISKEILGEPLLLDPAQKKNNGVKPNQIILENLKKQSCDLLKKDEVEKIIDFEVRTPQLSYLEKVEVKKQDDGKFTEDNIKDLGQRFFISYEKENKKSKINELGRDVDFSELEENQKIQMSVEVSLGGRILHNRRIDLENSEQEMGN